MHVLVVCIKSVSVCAKLVRQTLVHLPTPRQNVAEERSESAVNSPVDSPLGACMLHQQLHPLWVFAESPSCPCAYGEKLLFEGCEAGGMAFESEPSPDLLVER